MRTLTLDDAPTLDALLALLLATPDAAEAFDLSELPTYGGTEPRDTAGIWAWDEKRLLVQDGAGWRLIGRAGRPPIGAKRSVRVEVLLTDEEAADLDAQRGTLGRSEWLARASGLRS